MPNLVAIDVSVTDDRISLVFSHRAVAAAYFKYLEVEDARPAQQQPIPGYYRAAQLHAHSNEVTVALPNCITWFITCRLPDDEDSVTFTYMDADEAAATRWADNMLIFDKVPSVSSSQDQNKQVHVRRLWSKTKMLKKLDDLLGNGNGSSSKTKSPSPPKSPPKQTASNSATGRKKSTPGNKLKTPKQRQNQASSWWHEQNEKLSTGQKR
ncbi:hypothetical protein B0H63DRAFT_1466 [Podospora didyma]|uniref:Uncharacterized protein n=1 Tax=Podospora didyma TaxID=330526 RepID=A0AAE0P3P5_9PEZI|nr:hypothetical protein B0H63DRAFT_1466 [Podospora didyma]